MNCFGWLVAESLGFLLLRADLREWKICMLGEETHLIWSEYRCTESVFMLMGLMLLSMI